MLQHYTPWPPNGTLYLDPSICPEPCYPAVLNGKLLDLDCCNLVDGSLVEDAAKVSAKKLAKESEKAEKLAKQQARRDAIHAAKDAGTIKDLKAAVLALIEHLTEEGVIR
jgi:hypothetical protein